MLRKGQDEGESLKKKKKKKTRFQTGHGQDNREEDHSVKIIRSS